VITNKGPMYSVCCEAVFNNHKLVYRSALVGVGQSKNQEPVIIVELYRPIDNPASLVDDLKILGKKFPHTQNITKFMIHKSFPVDIRHNAKIFREKLASWAEQEGKYFS